MAQANSKWPRWPEGVKGRQLMHVRVAWDVDILFRAMFGTASPFAVRHSGTSPSACSLPFSITVLPPLSAVLSRQPCL